MGNSVGNNLISESIALVWVRLDLPLLLEFHCDSNWCDLIADNMTEGAGCRVVIDRRNYRIVMTPFQQ
jgi:hypothetical protein